MKKLIALLLALSMLFVLAACEAKVNVDVNGNNKESEATTTEATKDGETTEEADATEDTQGEEIDPPAQTEVMTHEEFMAAQADEAVLVEGYVQATQAWWSEAINVYMQTEEGGYYIYKLTCSEEDAAKLVPGTKIRVSGYKLIWEGLHEINAGATFEFVEAAPYVAEAVNMTDLLDQEGLEKYQGMFASFEGMTVEPSTDATGAEAAFLYGWDGSGEEGSDSDLYFNVSKDGQVYTFVVEYYLCDNNSAAYKAVQNLKIGDVIDLEGFVYWYSGLQLHTTSVAAAQ